MRAGFQLFRTRKQHESIAIDALEEQYNIALPPLYKLFVSTFFPGTEAPIEEQYYWPAYQQHRSAATVIYSPLYDNQERALYLGGLEILEMALASWKNNQNEPEWAEYGFFRIGYIGMGGGLYVGTREENRDKIFRVVWDWDEPYDEICDNIFELVRGLEQVYDPNDPPVGVTTYDQLYKNWGDEYWQIKEI